VVAIALTAFGADRENYNITKLGIGDPIIVVSGTTNDVLERLSKGQLPVTNLEATAVTISSNLSGANGESWDNQTDGSIIERWDDTGSTNKGSRVFQSDSVLTNSDDNSTFDLVMYRALNDSSEEIDWVTFQPQISDNTTNTEDSVFRLFIQIGGTETLVGTWDAAGFTSAGLLDSAGGFADNSISGADVVVTNSLVGATNLSYYGGGILLSNVVQGLP
jgi:hypothetical protein